MKKIKEAIKTLERSELRSERPAAFRFLNRYLNRRLNGKTLAESRETFQHLPISEENALRNWITRLAASGHDTFLDRRKRKEFVE
jgi:hypothetical protein